MNQSTCIGWRSGGPFKYQDPSRDYMLEKQCFKLIDPSAGKRGSKKFWNVEVKGNAMSVEYGRIDSTFFAPDPKIFPTNEKAEKAANSKIREKLNEGYVKQKSC